jgi:hypothetical protein
VHFFGCSRRFSGNGREKAAMCIVTNFTGDFSVNCFFMGRKLGFSPILPVENHVEVGENSGFPLQKIAYIEELCLPPSHTLWSASRGRTSGAGAVKSDEPELQNAEKKEYFVFCAAGVLCYNHHWQVLPCVSFFEISAP